MGSGFSSVFFFFFFFVVVVVVCFAIFESRRERGMRFGLNNRGNGISTSSGFSIGSCGGGVDAW